MESENEKNFGAKLKGFFGSVWAGIKKAALFVWKYLKIAGIATFKYLKTRWVGFFLLWPVVILSFIVPFVYKSGFFYTEYESMTAFALPFFIILSFALAFEKHTARYAPVAMFALSLVSLLVFIQTAYMHLSTVFFGGISGNVLEQAGFQFSFCTIALVADMLLCAVAMFFAQFANERSTKAESFDSAPETVLEVKDEKA
ncbi:MAG: hypothetical protein J1F39_06795 [Clostridiales bacterium]|nr:hypothetical protein [Clostridiales bacterium]